MFVCLLVYLIYLFHTNSLGPAPLFPPRGKPPPEVLKGRQGQVCLSGKFRVGATNHHVVPQLLLLLADFHTSQDLAKCLLQVFLSFSLSLSPPPSFKMHKLFEYTLDAQTA